MMPQTRTNNLSECVEIDGRSFVVLMPSMTSVAATALGEPVGTLAAYRESILEAIAATFDSG